MKQENQELINEFFEKYREEFPKVSYEQFKNIVFGPWRFLKTEMENGNLETVKFKYFGTFIVYKKKAEGELEKLNKRFKEGNIVETQYLKVKNIIEKFLNNES